METVGERFAEGTYFLPELIYSGEIFKQIAEIVKLFSRVKPKGKNWASA
jgi:methanogenic corrinoid protein MtbC1